MQIRTVCPTVHRFLQAIFILLLFLLPSIGQSQNDVNPNGYNVFYYGNDQKSSEGPMREGQPDGFWKTYYPDGKLKSEGNRRNFMLDSTWVFMNEEGDTVQKINYLYGKKNGYTYLFETLADTAKAHYLKTKELYINDIKQGVAYEYYPSGELFKVITYKDGKKDGPAKVLNKQGVVTALFRYRNDMLLTREIINQTDASGLRQGVWKTFYPSDKLETECTYLNGQLHGYYKTYDNQGEMTQMLRYEHGVVVPETQNTGLDVKIESTFYDDGTIKTSGGFVEGKPIGLHREYNPQGEVSASIVYNDSSMVVAQGIADKEGNKQGAWTFFYADGKSKTKGSYKDDKRTGEWIYYYPDGSVEQKGSFNNGRYHGTWLWYYPGGEILRSEVYYMGRSEGSYAEYNISGDIITQGEMLDGMREGDWTYTVGDNTEKGTYAGGMKQGKWEQLYPNGKLMYEGQYRSDLPDGKHKYYYENGRLKLEAFYMLGRKTGTWKKYDENGELIFSATYENDELVKIDGKKITLEN